MSSCASTGRSPGFLLPKVASEAPYFRKLPAIQWYSPVPVRFSTASPQLRRCSLAPPSPEEALPAPAADPERPRPSPATLNVQDFGAVGDGSKDNTDAFIAAMRVSAETGNYAVFVPRGRYLIKGTLEVPA